LIHSSPESDSPQGRPGLAQPLPGGLVVRRGLGTGRVCLYVLMAFTGGSGAAEGWSFLFCLLEALAERSETGSVARKTLAWCIRREEEEGEREH
jgi:hypothetical protein